jgi:hypothetical protein
MDAIHEHDSNRKFAKRTVCSVAARDLKVGQILLSDVLMGNGALLIKAGNWISETLA